MEAVDVAAVGDRRQAAALLAHPLRPRIVAMAAEPASASELAARLGLPRQRVNYHVRQLARARFLRRAGQVRKRNLIEQRYVATARAYVLAPEVLGPLAADRAKAEDAFSAARLVALAAEAQADVSHAVAAAAAQGKRLATLSMSAEIRFASADEREAFTHALQSAVIDVIARHTSPPSSEGRPYRLVLGCYPERPRPERGAQPPSETEWGWGPTRSEKRHDHEKAGT